MFLRYQNSLVQDEQALAASDAIAAQNARAGDAASMKVSIADFQKINPVYLQLATALQAIDVDANAYRDAALQAKQPLDVAAIKQFSARREQAVANARAQIQKSLTPAGWQAVSNYIESSFRQKVRRVQAGQ
jgi:hypothetical protein